MTAYFGVKEFFVVPAEASVRQYATQEDCDSARSVKPISSPRTDVNPIGKEHESHGQHEEGGIDAYLSPVRFASGYRMSGHRFGRYLTRHKISDRASQK